MIREAGGNDREALGKVYCLSWKEGYRGILPAAYLDLLTPESCAPKSIIPKNNLIAEWEGSVAGVVSFGPARDEAPTNTGEIRAIYVLPELWRHSLGKALFSAAAERMRGQGMPSFYLWVLKDNVRARGFYEKMGMKNAGIDRVINIGGENFYEIKYELLFPG
ncbi:MAG: GNAT family N-acetyltransferase [Christensenellales bacterium]|jgi:ribosomal protein S18 acetylase RimI-like enzyme